MTTGIGGGNINGTKQLMVPLTANRYSYFLRRQRNLERWTVCSSALLKSAPWDRSAMQAALDWLVKRHDGLRLRFSQTLDGCVQWIAAPHDIRPLIVHRSRFKADTPGFASEMAAYVQALRDGFRCADDLFRLLAMELPDGRVALMIVAHHLAVDARSLQVVQEDLFPAYEHIRTGKGTLPEAPTVGYAEFAHDSIAHWLDRAHRVLPHWRTLPWHVIRPWNDGCGAYREEDLEERHTREIQVVLQAWHTARELRRHDLVSRVLVALARAHRRWTGQPALHLAMVFHGREIFGARDLTRTVGWLSSTVPIVLDAQCAEDDALRYEAERQMRMAQAYGTSYGTLRYLADDPALKREFSAHPSPGLSLNVVLPGAPQIARDQIAQPLIGIDPGTATPPDTLRVFPISGGLVVRDGNLVLAWDFSSRLFAPESMQRFGTYCREEFERSLGGSNGVRATQPIADDMEDESQ